MSERATDRHNTKRFRPPVPVDKIVSIDSSTLAAMAAHEFREPLQAIRSFLSVVVNGRVGPLTDLQAEFLGSANQAARRASRMVEDFLFVTQGGNSLEIRPVPISFLARVRACCWELSNIDGHRELAVDSRLEDCEVFIGGDQDRIDQIILNLLENACRYGVPDKPIDVSVWRDASHVVLWVTNGVAQADDADPSTWFVPFYRGVEASTSGIGLGLCVAYWLVDAHDGEISVLMSESEVTMEVRLPLLDQGTDSN